MTSFNLTSSGTGNYLLENGDVGVIDVGVVLSPSLTPTHIYNQPVLMGGGWPAPIWLTVKGSIQSVGEAIVLVGAWHPDFPPIFRQASIMIEAGGSVLQDSSSTGVAAAAISGAAANSLLVNNAGMIQGDIGISIAVQASGDYFWGLSGNPYHWDSSGFSMMNSGWVTGTSGAAILVRGTGTSGLVNSGTITGQGVGGAYLSTNYSLLRDFLENAGTMAASSSGQVAISTGLGDDWLNNSGLITGKVWMGDGEDRLTNSGTISNAVVMGAGADTYTGTGIGKVNGAIQGGMGDDVLIGGDLAAGDKLFGEQNNDSLVGNGGADTLDGGSGNDTILGGTGADSLVGSVGADSLNGGAASDILLGGAGVDTLTGGVSNDHFTFVALNQLGDIITDFAAIVGNNDDFQIKASSFGGGLTVGVLAASQFQMRADNIAQDADDRFIFRSTDKTLWFDVDGFGGSGPLLVADLQAGAVVTAADIVLY